MTFLGILKCISLLIGAGIVGCSIGYFEKKLNVYLKQKMNEYGGLK